MITDEGLREPTTKPGVPPADGLSVVRRGFDAIAWLFPRSETTDVVSTSLLFDAPPHAVWKALVFYEDVPIKPMLLLRLFLPRPLRTDGHEVAIGALVRCVYEGGLLVKRITEVEPARLLGFDVVSQELGIEGSVSMGHGSYELRAEGERTRILLTTMYRGHLRPRGMWRPFERFLGHAVHRHILIGMRDAVRTEVSGVPSLPPGIVDRQEAR